MGNRPGWRVWVILTAALIVYLVVFDRLERLAVPDAPTPAATSAEPEDPPESLRPTVTRIEDGVEIGIGWYRTTVRLGAGEGSVNDLAACIERAIDDAEADGRLAGSPTSAGWLARFRREAEIAEEMNRLVAPCLRGAIGAPAPIATEAESDQLEGH